jgi:hypothetical protein
LYDAECYAEVTYSNLRDKKNGIDQNSEVIVLGAHNLANVILKQKGDWIKAEELTRESLRIKTVIYGSDNNAVEGSYNLLIFILEAILGMKRGDYRSTL